MLNCRGMIKLISLLRHDFLNQLQVIDGYLQVGKADRAREYLQEVVKELNKLGKLVHLQVPEIALVILLAAETANRAGIRISYMVESDLSGCLVPGRVAGSALSACLQMVLELLSESTDGVPTLEVWISEQEENLYLELVFDLPGGSAGVEDQIATVSGSLAEYGGRITLEKDRNLCKHRLALVLPQRN